MNNIKNISEILPDEPVRDPFEDEINFNNTVREYIVSKIIFYFALIIQFNEEISNNNPTLLEKCFLLSFRMRVLYSKKPVKHFLEHTDLHVFNLIDSFPAVWSCIITSLPHFTRNHPKI